MNSISIGTLVFACTFGGALAGIWLRALLPEHHLGSESKDTVKLGIGLIATMTALVLGLVTASAKSSFDDISKAVKHSAADVLALDRTLARYGPETKEIRQALHDTVQRRLELIWPEQSTRAVELIEPDRMRGAEGLVDRIRSLSPQNDHQRWLQSRALTLGEALLDARWVIASSVGTSVPVPFLVILIFWLTIIFTSFGLFAPKNATVIAVFFVCTLSVSSAIFLILEMENPFQGVIKISADPLRYAYARLNQ
jgi:hypothetical protein